MLRRLHPDQPDSFAFTQANQTWAEGQVTKFPEGRQASAVIPLLWRAQEQEGWLTRPAMEYIARMLDMDYIRVLEVATFYFMFQLQPVGSIAHIQICGTLSCMICGAEDLVAVCKDKIADQPHALSADGKFSWEEVECLGSCANAPMAQIGKDYYEDLTTARLAEIIDELAAGKVPLPGPQNGRYAAEPLKGLTSLTEYEEGQLPHNASVARAAEIGDTVKRIDGTEVPILTPWVDGGAGVKERPAQRSKTTAPKAPNAKTHVGEPKGAAPKAASAKPNAANAKPSAGEKASTQNAPATKASAPKSPAAKGKTTSANPVTAIEEVKPEILNTARAGGADDLKRISGVGPKLEGVLNDMGFWHFDQIAKWTSSEVAWVDSRLKFKGRIERDNWIAQAAELAKE